MRFSFRITAFVFATAAGAIRPCAQVPDAPAANPAASAPQTTAAPASGGSANAAQKSSGPSFLGRDIPSFDPGTEILSWDGKNWNVNNNRVFQARFEKYLNAPEETTAEDRQYQAIIAHVLQLLAPGNATRENVDTAFRLLARGSNFDID
ncbi:MAG TPA: hypothetical protein VFV83_03445, partial [Chthoniobacteraceae bacterium]|nr:hypothetical protein [Chthoniobacteraceae bacterium]